MSPYVAQVQKVVGCFTDLAFNPEKSKGRRNSYPDPDVLWDECGVDPYVTDGNKILNSKALRRLSGKTQVFASPSNRHVRTRGIHTNEVVALSQIVAELLGLNVPLCQAIALGHDIGHAPFGHLGEEVISYLESIRLKKLVQFRHERNALFVAQEIERSGQGLNLTFETLQGILYHSRDKNTLSVDHSLPLEYGVVMLCDKIAYTFGDINDAVRCGLPKISLVLPYAEKLGKKQRDRVLNCIFALVLESEKNGVISFSESSEAMIFEEIRQALYLNVYKAVDRSVQRDALVAVYDFFKDHPRFEDCNCALALSLLTDRDIISLANELLTISNVFADSILDQYEIAELIPTIRSKKVDFNREYLDFSAA